MLKSISHPHLNHLPGAGTKRVFIVYTGGTIGMKKTDNGYAPAKGYFEKMINKIPDFHSPNMPAFVVEEYDPPLDSSDMQPEDWVRIAKSIERHYTEFDGFVVIHGTDTMAYTASALSFMMENLSKPVVITGSQIPMCHFRNDARDNLSLSLMIAAYTNINEVCIFFNNKLLRGNRSRKVAAWALQAFDSANFPWLATVGIDIQFRNELFWKSPREHVSFWTDLETDVVAVRLFPGMNPSILSHILQPPLKGLVLEAYGSGNAPARKVEILQSLKAAIERGVIIVVVTQCYSGTVDLEKYANGEVLQQIGCVSGLDLTAEAALTKLCYLLGKYRNHPNRTEEVQRLMSENLRGELTPPETQLKIEDNAYGSEWMRDDDERAGLT